MKRFCLACSLAVGMAMFSLNVETANADHGHGGGYRAPACHVGHGYGQGYGQGYRAGYRGYGPVVYSPGIFVAPAVGVGRGFYPSAFANPYQFGVPYGAGYGYGHRGSNFYGRGNLPRVQLRIGF